MKLKVSLNYILGRNGKINGLERPRLDISTIFKRQWVNSENVIRRRIKKIHQE